LSTEPKRPSEVRPDLGISAALEAVILKAMAKDRDQRYKSMTELDADLAQLETGGEVGATLGPHLETGPRRGGIRPGGRARVLMWVAGVALVIGAVAFAVPKFLPGDAPSAQATPPSPPPSPSPSPNGVSIPSLHSEVPTVTIHVTS